jgi:hypothetical protein
LQISKQKSCSSTSQIYFTTILFIHGITCSASFITESYGKRQIDEQKGCIAWEKLELASGSMAQAWCDPVFLEEEM